MLKIEDIFADLKTLETSRLVLRKLKVEDAQDMFEYCSDEEMTPFLTWDAHKTIDDSMVFIQKTIEKYKKSQVGEWGIVLKETGKLVGTCGFLWWMPECGRVELAYAIARSLWGKGLMTEAVSEVIRFGFDKMELNRIEARAIPENIASIRVMQKIGMTKEGLHREQMIMHGKFVDLSSYAILKRDYSI